jgi:hypothetical protein
VQAYIVIVRPLQHRQTPHFRTIIEHDGFWIAALDRDRAKYASHSLSGDGEICFEHKVLAGAVVADRQNAKTSICSQPIVDEIKTPAMVRARSRRVDRPAPKRQLTLYALAHLKIRADVDAMNALAVVGKAFAAQQNSQPR